MEVDVRTLILCNVLMSAFYAGALLFFRINQRTYPGFSWWVASAYLLPAAYAALFLKGMIPELACVLSANGCFVLAGLLRFEGTVRFVVGRELDRRWYLLVPFQLAIAAYFLLVVDSAPTRFLSLAVVVTLLMWAGVRVLVGPFAPANCRLYRALGGVYFAYGLTTLVRAVAWMRQPELGFAAPEHMHILFFLVVIVFEAASSFMFVMMHSQRLEEELEESTADLVSALKKARDEASQLKRDMPQSRLCEACGDLVADDLPGLSEVTRRSPAEVQPMMARAALLPGHPEGERGESEAATAQHPVSRDAREEDEMAREEYPPTVAEEDVEEVQSPLAAVEEAEVGVETPPFVVEEAVVAVETPPAVLEEAVLAVETPPAVLEEAVVAVETLPAVLEEAVVAVEKLPAGVEEAVVVLETLPAVRPAPPSVAVRGPAPVPADFRDGARAPVAPPREAAAARATEKPAPPQPRWADDSREAAFPSKVVRVVEAMGANSGEQKEGTCARDHLGAGSVPSTLRGASPVPSSPHRAAPEPSLAAWGSRVSAPVSSSLPADPREAPHALGMIAPPAPRGEQGGIECQQEGVERDDVHGREDHPAGAFPLPPFLAGSGMPSQDGSPRIIEVQEAQNSRRSILHLQSRRGPDSPLREGGGHKQRRPGPGAVGSGGGSARGGRKSGRRRPRHSR